MGSGQVKKSMKIFQEMEEQANAVEDIKCQER